MARYNYRYTARAERDISEIDRYISEQLSAPEAAVQLILDMRRAVRNICQFPFLHPLSRDPRLRRQGVRLIVVGNYNLLYVVKSNTVIVRRVLYGRRDYGTLT